MPNIGGYILSFIPRTGKWVQIGDGEPMLKYTKVFFQEKYKEEHGRKRGKGETTWGSSQQWKWHQSKAGRENHFYNIDTKKFERL